MTGACARCGADDELLFTCRHCQRRFCERHELPHHACQFRNRQEVSDPSETDAAPEPASEPPAASGATTAGPGPATTATTEAETPARAPEPTTSTEAESESPGTGRAMDSRRAVGVVSPASSPRSLGEWLARQTYVTLLFKVGGLALLINVAFYGGVALTLYDPFGLL